MSSNDPCECGDMQDPGYGGICHRCQKECFRQVPIEDERDDNPYRCRECLNLVMYRSDHKQDCVHYPQHSAFHGRES